MLNMLDLLLCPMMCCGAVDKMLKVKTVIKPTLKFDPSLAIS